MKPMLCKDGRIERLSAREWAFEGKWDGYRLVVEVRDGVLRLTSRSGRDVTGEFAKLAGLAGQLADFHVVLDGEAVALDDNGDPEFAAIQNHRRHPRVEFWAFDILSLDGRDLTKVPYADRRRVLETFAKLTGITVPPLIDCVNGAGAMDYTRARGWEGVVAKRLDSRYDEGRRSELWLKDKHWEEREVVICGWRPGEGNREGRIGSLLMGVPDGQGGLQFVGRVGTGFNTADLAYLDELLTPLVTDSSPFNAAIPADEARKATYVEPIHVGEVRYGLQTADGRLRFPSWRGLRTDKTVETIR